MSNLKQKIAKSLIKTRIGLTTREIAQDWNLKPVSVSGMCQQMELDGTIAKGEYLECEGRMWSITAKGIENYGSKEAIAALTVVVEVAKKKRGRPRKVVAV